MGARACGNWPAILTALGIDAEHLRNRHGPCPGCGGHDRFRFDDRDGRGTWYCGGGGNPESGDGFDLLRHVHGYARKDALHAVSGWLGDDVLRPKPEAVKTPPPMPEPVWTATLPVPASASDGYRGIRHPEYGEAVRWWRYPSARGELMFAVARFQTAAGKAVRPASFGQFNFSQRPAWRWKRPQVMVPWNLPELYARPDAPVVVAEGEKAAEAAGLLLPEYVATCGHGGAAQAHLTHWGHLSRRDVLIWSGEDDAKDTLVPRLLAAGGYPRRVHFVAGVSDGETSRPFDPARDLPDIAEFIRERNVRLLIVDPVVSAVAGDSHQNAEVRRSLQPLVDLGRETGCAVLGITHLSKGTAGRDPLERVTGSLAFGALARVVLLAARQRENEDRVLARAKSNIGPDSGGWAYRLAQVQVPGCPGVYNSAVYWTGAVEGSAREIMRAAEEDDEQRSARDEAVEWLREALADGPVAAKELQRQAKDAGLSWTTIKRAKGQAGAVSKRDGFAPDSGWRWSLDQEDHA